MTMTDKPQEMAIRLLYTSVRPSGYKAVQTFALTMSKYPERWNFIRVLRIHKTLRLHVRDRHMLFECAQRNTIILHILSQLVYLLSVKDDEDSARHLSSLLECRPIAFSWDSFRVLSLEVPINDRTPLIVQVLNAIPHLNDLSLYWILEGYVSGYDRALIAQDSIELERPASFPPSKGLHLLLVQRFSWNGNSDGVDSVVNMKTVQLLASSQFAPTCAIQMKGWICHTKAEAEELAIFFQRHAYGSWDLVGLYSYRSPWDMRSALQTIRGPVVCSFTAFV
jgi:hypothetical protein